MKSDMPVTQLPRNLNAVGSSTSHTNSEQAFSMEECNLFEDNVLPLTPSAST